MRALFATPWLLGCVISPRALLAPGDDRLSCRSCAGGGGRAYGCKVHRAALKSCAARPAGAWPGLGFVKSVFCLADPRRPPVLQTRTRQPQQVAKHSRQGKEEGLVVLNNTGLIFWLLLLK